MTTDTALSRAMSRTVDPPLCSLPDRVAELLIELGGPPRLAAHLRAVHDVAHQLVDWMGKRYPAVPRGRSQPLWWTLRRPWRPLNYDAARAMFRRANEVLGANWTLHDLRHTATFLMLDDPNLSPVYVQHILGHKNLSTLDIYNNPSHDDVITAGLAHHARQQKRRETPPPPPPAPSYNPASLDNLFGGLLS